MTQYRYTIRTTDSNELFTSTCSADNPSVLRSGLKRMGYKVDSITPLKHSSILGQRKRIKLKDMVSMCRRFSIMYGAGMSLLDCLSSLATDNESKRLSDILQDVHDRIEQGSNVADAFAGHSNVFSPLFINLLRAGETAGEFEYVLGQLAMYIEQEYELKKSIRQALAYPIVVVIMIFVVVTILMIFVVPTFSDVYTRLGIVLPLPTVILMAVSNNAVYIFPSVILLVVGLWFLYRKFRSARPVKVRIDRMKLSTPMTGAVYQKILLLKFIRTLSIMISAGIQLIDAVAVAADVASNTVVTEAANMIQRNIKRGGTITEAIKLHDLFPQFIVHAFSTGEEAGKLAQMLDKVIGGIEQDVDDAIKKLIVKIEPALMVVMSICVGYILMAIYLPIFDMVQMLRK